MSRVVCECPPIGFHPATRRLMRCLPSWMLGSVAGVCSARAVRPSAMLETAAAETRNKNSLRPVPSPFFSDIVNDPPRT